MCGGEIKEACPYYCRPSESFPHLFPPQAHTEKVQRTALESVKGQLCLGVQFCLLWDDRHPGIAWERGPEIRLEVSASNPACNEPQSYGNLWFWGEEERPPWGLKVYSELSNVPK